MTNTLAIWFLVLIGLAVGYDLWANDGAALTFLARKGIDLLQWMAFWR